MKTVNFFYLKNLLFWVVKFSIYLNRRVFCNVLLKHIVCWYLLEPPRQGGSNEFPQSMF